MSKQKATLGLAKNKREDSTEWRINWRRWIFPTGTLYQAYFYCHLPPTQIQNFFFLNLRMALSASSCWKVLFVFKDAGALDASESLLMLFSGIYYPSVYIGGILEVKHCSCVGSGEPVCLLGIMLKSGPLIVYMCPNAALLNSTFGQVHFFPLLLQLCYYSDNSFYHRDSGLICCRVL